MDAKVNRKYYYSIFALALCALITPLLVVQFPPLIDLPNHLARIFILANYDQVLFFQENFRIVYEPIPNIAQEVIVVPLMKVFDIWTANRLFLILTVVLFALGCHLISHRNRADISYSAIHASFLIYGWIFLYGLVNYVFGIALFLVTFGLWMRWRDHLSLVRFSLLIILTFAIYLAHFSAIAIFGLAVVAVHAYDFLLIREGQNKWTFLASDGSLFVLPMLTFLWYADGFGNVGPVTWYFTEKLFAASGPFLSYDLWLDAFCVVIPVLVYYWMKRCGLISYDKKILFAGVLFLLIFLLAPYTFFTWDADKRILLPGFVFLILSLKINAIRGNALLLFTIVICFLVFRQGVIAYRWIQMSEKLATERSLFAAITPESKVYPLFFSDPSNPPQKIERPVEHTINLVAIENNSFSASLWALRGEQPLNFHPSREYASLGNKDKDKWKRLIEDYDYVWTFGVSQNVLDELRKRAIIVAENEKTKIWKLNK